MKLMIYYLFPSKLKKENLFFFKMKKLPIDSHSWVEKIQNLCERKSISRF